jgi:hypothetical protein
MKSELLEKYRSKNQSNISVLNEEINNMKEELNGVSPIKVTDEFCQEILEHVKYMRFIILSFS